MDLVDTKVEVHYKRRCQDGKDSERHLHKGVREEAVKLVTEGGLSIPEVGREIIDPHVNHRVLGQSMAKEGTLSEWAGSRSRLPK